MQFSTQLPSSGGIIFQKRQNYSLLKEFNIYFIGSVCPTCHRIGNARGVKKPHCKIIRGARGVAFMEDIP